MILFCPDLTGKEEVKAMLIGNGDFVRPVLNPCIKEKCVAYKDGKCMKYNNEVERESERTNKGEFSPYQYYKSNGYEILEWSDYMNKEFTKADLRDGMVVEQRDGDMYLVLAGMVVRKRGYNRIGDYDDDLKCAGYTGGDIVKVYRITPGLLGCIKDVFIKGNLELIWERKEPKKMTVEEMRKKLEELTGEEIEVTE